MRGSGGQALVVAAVLGLLWPAVAGAQPIVTCQFNSTGEGDSIDRGFYVPNFPASHLGRVQLALTSTKPGEHVFALTARDGTYRGPLIGTAIASALLSGDDLSNYDPVLSFDFYGASVTAGHIVTFAVTAIRTPPASHQSMNTGLEGTCSVPVWETEDTSSSLSVQRHAYMGVTIYEPEPVNHNTYWVPAVSHVSGASSARWRSDVKLLNRGAVPANVTLRLHEGINPTRTIVVGPGGATPGQALIDDVVVWIAPLFSGSAALEVNSDQPLTVESRNYDLVAADSPCTPLGTFGQLYDAFTPNMGFIAGQTAFLVGLAESSEFRTNIGLTNIGSTPAQATVSLCGPDGKVLATYPVSLDPGEWKQAYRPFNGQAHRIDLDSCYAKVAITAGNGVIVYGSVADWLTNDATTVVGKL